MVNALRKEFDLGGVPLRLTIRAPVNPYTKAARLSGVGRSKAATKARALPPSERTIKTRLAKRLAQRKERDDARVTMAVGSAR